MLFSHFVRTVSTMNNTENHLKQQNSFGLGLADEKIRLKYKLSLQNIATKTAIPL